MDLGTVKVRLHALVYKSRRSVANDIRLVFRNAMKYNPPHNSVHISAKELLAFFEDQLLAFAPELTMTTPNDGSESLDKSTLPLPRALNASALKGASNEKISRTVSSSFDQLTITGLASAASQE